MSAAPRFHSVAIVAVASLLVGGVAAAAVAVVDVTVAVGGAAVAAAAGAVAVAVAVTDVAVVVAWMSSFEMTEWMSALTGHRHGTDIDIDMTLTWHWHGLASKLTKLQRKRIDVGRGGR